MADDRVTNELMYETLKAIRNEVVDIARRLDRLEGEVRVIRQHVAALVESDMRLELHPGDAT